MNVLMFLYASALMLFSCAPPSTVVKEGKPKLSSLMYVVMSEDVLFYKNDSREFYLVQLGHLPSLSGNVEFVSYKSTELVVKVKGNVLSYSTKDGSAIGISVMQGEEYEQNFLTDDQTSFVPNIEPVVLSMSCHCISNDQAAEANCDSGGEGSESCSLSLSGGAAGASINTSCSVSCSAGYFPCCNYW